MRLSEFLNDLKITEAASKAAESKHSEASTRLIDALSLVGSPLKEHGSVVIGNVLIKRPYGSLPVVCADIANVSPDTVVVAE